jgi:hypothetical protein
LSGRLRFFGAGNLGIHLPGFIKERLTTGVVVAELDALNRCRLCERTAGGSEEQYGDKRGAYDGA